MRRKQSSFMRIAPISTTSFSSIIRGEISNTKRRRIVKNFTNMRGRKLRGLSTKGLELKRNKIQGDPRLVLRRAVLKRPALKR
jgi:hypothetical protein